MRSDFNFFRTNMPDTRQADYYLGCLNGSVFMDFNRSDDNKIHLVRISFDHYGCCSFDESNISMNSEDSRMFIEEIEKEELNQEILERLIKRVINANKNYIWGDAISEYGLC